MFDTNQSFKLLILTLVAGLLVNVLALPIGWGEKRAIVTVIQTINYNQATAAAQAAPAPTVVPTYVAPAAPAATNNDNNGAGGFFANLFGGVKTSAATTAAPVVVVVATDIVTQAAAPVATTSAAAVAAPAPVAATTPAASTNTNTAQGLFSSIFSGLSNFFGIESGSSSSSSSGSSSGSSNNQPSSSPSSAPASGSSGNSGNSGGSSGVNSGIPSWNSVTGVQQSIPTGASSGDYNSQYAEGALGITYSPYQKNGACKTSSQVAYDIAKLSSYSIIRLYSTDCSGIENVLASITSSQKLFLGVWNIDTASVQGGLSDIQNAVSTSSRGWGAVDTISIGNELVNDGKATVADINAALGTARSWLKANAPQYTGPVVSVDTLVAVQNNPGLCTASDYIAVNCHPFFTGSIQPQDSGSWLKQQIANLRGVCGGSKPIIITETGWPTQGNSIGTCVPSKQNQQYALQSIMSTLGSQVFAFTMYNDYWKAPGPYGVEQYWGIFGDPLY